MTARMDELTATLTDLIGLRDRTKVLRRNLSLDDLAAILGPLYEAIKACEEQMTAAYVARKADGASELRRERS